MRILQVCPIFPPQPGKFASGVTQVVYHISQQLVSRGHEVDIYAANALDLRRKVESDLLVIDGIKVHYFPYIMHYYTFFLTPSLIPMVRKNLRTFDVVHIHDFRTIQAVIVGHYAKKLNVPYLMQPHGSIPHYGAREGFKKLYDVFQGYSLLKDASKVIALTPMEVEQCQKMGLSVDRITIVPNGVTPALLDRIPVRGAFRQKKGIGAEEKLIMYLGRIHRRKGLDLLIRVFASLPNSPRSRLVIIGMDDGYLSSITDLVANLGVADRVIISTESPSEEDKLEAYVDSDVHVLPAPYEPFGLTVIESWACGTPVVTINTCGIADWVNSYGGYSVLYDESELRRALLTLITDEDLRKRLGQGGQKLVAERFTWDKIAVQIENLYQEVAGKAVITNKNLKG